MAERAPLAGVVPIVPTPFTAGEDVDFEALAGLVEFAVSRDLPGVCLPAYASEYYKLSEAERRQAVATAVTTAAGRTRVVAQANHPSAKLAAELAKQYEQ